MSFFSAAGKLLEKAAVQLDKAAVSLDSAFDLPPALPTSATGPSTTTTTTTSTSTTTSTTTNTSANATAATTTTAPSAKSSVSAAPVLVDSDLGIVWSNTGPSQSSRAASPSPIPASTVTRDSSSRLERRLGGLFRSESHIANGNAEQSSNTAVTEPFSPSVVRNSSRRHSSSPIRPQDIPLPPSPVVFPCDEVDHSVPALSISQPWLPPPPPAAAGPVITALSPQPPNVEPDAVELSHSSRQLIRSLLAKVQARDATIAQLQSENATIAAQREQDRQVEGTALNAELKRSQALHAQLDQANATIHSLSARLSDTCGQWEANRRDFESRIALLQAELDSARNSTSAHQVAGSPHVSASPNNVADPLAADLQQAVSFWAQKCGELERQLAASQSSVASLESKLQASATRSVLAPSKPIVEPAPVVPKPTSPSKDNLAHTLRLRIQQLEEQLLDQQCKLASRPEPATAPVAAFQCATPDGTPTAPTTAPSTLQTQMETMRAVKEQLATQVMQLSRELAQLRTQHAELAAREDTLLELLGEREAEVEDLKEMLQDAKEAYKAQLEALMEAVGQKQ